MNLVILHIDGLGADSLEDALKDGDLPFTKSLIEREGYEIHRYRCGVPSTTPFAQAGILYGDNSNIPSFRWWDREQQLLVQFGTGSTFKKVAHKFFAAARALTDGGACIAACYPGSAAEDFGIAYQERSYGRQKHSRSAWSVVGPYLADPRHLADWAWHTIATAGRIILEVVRSRAQGHRPPRTYVISDALEEIFVHHLTRYAVVKAMDSGLSPIYAGFYAFDETGHAFGPDDSYAKRILRHVDHTIRKVAEARRGRYELIVLSDHGQIDTVPFNQRDGVHLGEFIARFLPRHHIKEMKGRSFGPAEADAAGVVNVTYSGGLAHLYFAGETSRLSHDTLRERHPRLVEQLAALDRVGLVLTRRGEADVFTVSKGEMAADEVPSHLAHYDDPDILLGQLSRLNSFPNSGDIILFGTFEGGRQVNFENQAGGHGSIGGEQLHPFVLAKREWQFDTTQVHGAHELHPILSALRDRLQAA